MPSRLKVISIHSVKGGAGKTTLALLLAKLLATRGEKTCLVDLDIAAPGIEYAVKLRNVRRRLNEYLLQPEAAQERITLADLLAEYSDAELREGMLKVVCVSTHRDPEQQQQLVDLIRYEPRIGAAKPRMLELLDEIEEAGFAYCVLDCHPGVILMSAHILDWLREAKAAWVPVFVSLVDRPQIFSTLEELPNFADGLALIVNRVDPDVNIRRLSELKTLVGADKVYPSEAVQTAFGMVKLSVVRSLRDWSKFRTHIVAGGAGLLDSKATSDEQFDEIMDAILGLFGKKRTRRSR